MSELQTDILGGLLGDPAVYAFQKTTGEGLLFDLGSIERIAQRDLMKVRHVFVSHAHMDHFMGFDRWLRVNIPHRRLLKIWGPAPFFARVQARLRSFSWNLIEEDQLRFEVGEIRPDGSVRSALLRNTTDFAIEELSEAGSIEALTTLADGAVVSCAQLSHVNIPSLAYKVQGADKMRFLHEKLEGMGLSRGPWISRLQTQVAYGPLTGDFPIGDKIYPLQELMTTLLRREEGRSFAYLTDLSFDRSNITQIRQQLGKATHVICEASFLDQDRARAVAKAHLTTRQAALIAMVLSAEVFEIFHVSTIYGGDGETSRLEALAIFETLRQASAEEQEAALEAEFLAVETVRAQS